jgi:hypothetical protein
VDGKERILPEIMAFEQYQKQMQDLMMQNQQMQAQMQEMQTGMANQQEIIDQMMAGQRGAGGMYPTATESDAVLDGVEGAGV